MARLAILLLLLFGCGTSSSRRPAATSESRETVNLRAFARLYGVVRWFHPSDEAAETDWNAFAIRGVSVARAAPDQRELARALQALVSPLGPTIVIGTAEEVARAPAPPAPPAGAAIEQVAWQYAGPGFDGGHGPYQGKRTARTGYLRVAGGWGAFSQAVDGAALRGKRVRLRAELRAGRDTSVGAWLRVDLPGGRTGFFDNMMDRAVTTATWQRGTIEGDVAADAVRVVVGGLVTGDEGWFDDFVLEVSDGAGAWTVVPLADADFERGVTAWATGIGKKDGPPPFTLEVEAGARGASAAANLRSPRVPLVAEPFTERPDAGEVVIVDLGDGLQARVPISLPSVDGHTWPAAAAAPTTFASALGEAASREPREDTAAIADVIVAWNVFAHFYPYLDVISTDWHAYLDEALAKAGTADALEALVVAAEDGHGRVTSHARRKLLPAVLELVEGKVVVIVSADEALTVGDEIIAIDGVAAATALDAERARQSGSPQWRLHLAQGSLGAGPEGSAAAVELRRGGVAMSAVVKRGQQPALYTYPPLGEVEPGIWLVDLSRAEIAGINANLEALAKAKGIVFDLRGYPNSTHAVLAHLMDAPEQDRWMHVAHVIRPNLPGQPLPVHGWTSHGWDLKPIAPRFAGKIVFLTGPGAISYAESVMGYVETLGLPIVGAATAGTNGNIHQVPLPSGASFVFTGMKVTRHDGTRSHLEGIRPTVPVSRTIAGVLAGKDEVLERGLTFVR